ncbi:hypothetical protein [Paenibacillus sp. YAF4_2]|uniref:hypothetical protein n=1 Tax=Paenibacillus sp. YAF4_2 TaxID=3233085 RepID=UPI003F9DCD67
MRLLIIAPEQIPVPPFSGGSVENCIYQISKHVSYKYQITIVSRSNKNLPSKSVFGNTTIIRVPGKAAVDRFSWKHTARKLMKIYET